MTLEDRVKQLVPNAVLIEFPLTFAMGYGIFDGDGPLGSNKMVSRGWWTTKENAWQSALTELSAPAGGTK